MSKKRKKNKSEFRPANQEQQQAIDAGQEFIEHGDGDQWLTIMGKAGTGKTTVVGEIIAPYVRRRRIVVAAVAHKAKLVLATKLEERFGKNTVAATTIASLLAMKMDEETGEFNMSSSTVLAPIQEVDIILIDEGSMINEQALDLIMQRKLRSAKVIFLGDIGQLPPIREKEDQGSDRPSPIFNTPNRVTLYERIRQGEESPILPYADIYWDNGQSIAPLEDPVPTIRRGASIVNAKGSLVFGHSRSALPIILPMFQLAVKEGRTDLIKIVAYRNNTRRTLNDRIRNAIFGQDAVDQFLEGDLLMFMDNHELGTMERISNATEIQVKDLSRARTEDGWNVWKIGFSHEGNPTEVETLSWVDDAKWKRHLDTMANQIKTMRPGAERVQAWAEFWGQKKRFAPLEHAYAITSHKAQGSTYDAVVVAEADIVGVSAITAKAKSKSIYTAITRARHMVVIMDGRSDQANMVQLATDNTLAKLGTVTELEKT